MGAHRIRAARFAQLKKTDRTGLTALTILRARRFLADYPDHGPAWHLLGIALIGLARYEEAEDALGRSLRFCPRSIQSIPLGAFGHLFKERGDYETAVGWYRRAIEAAPDDADGYIYLGEVLAKQGRLDEAEQAHRRGVLCGVGCVDEAYLNLGFVLRARERFEEAAECFREAIRLDPDYRLARKALRDAERCIGFLGDPS